MSTQRRRRADYGEPASRTESEAFSQETQPVAPVRDLLATNTGVRLACTMAAMMGLFAIFLCYAERESRVIRRFAVQSAALTAVHAAVGAVLLIISSLLGGIPFFGLMVTLLCLLTYISVFVVLLVIRVRLMLHAWRGVRFDLSRTMERMIARYY